MFELNKRTYNYSKGLISDNKLSEYMIPVTFFLYYLEYFYNYTTFAPLINTHAHTAGARKY